MVDRTKLAVRSVIRVFARVLNHLTGGSLTPNTVTLFGLAMHIPIAWLIATRHNLWAAGLLVIFGLFDTLDGELAHLQKRESVRGALLDSVTDRMKEVMLYSGAAYALIASSSRPYMALWAVAACGCSLLTSYVNAAGDVAVARASIKEHATNKTFRVGLLPFEIRMCILIVGLLTNHLSVAVIVIALGAAYTAVSRLLRVITRLSEANG
jgi:phosphatidylglycerophosphate synthase